MAAPTHKFNVEEKGFRPSRSTDVYLPKAGLKDTAVCKKCALVYHDKRWVLDEQKGKELLADTSVGSGICPACRRMADNNPAGVVIFTGEYFSEHENEILNLLNHIEAKSRTKNPLGRIMEISQEGKVLTVTTTEDKLAQKLGREVFKAHKGELHYSWSHEEGVVRVSWKR